MGKEQDLIISGVHLELTPALKTAVEKTEKLFQHEERMRRMRVELEYRKHKKTNHNRFIAKGHIEINGAGAVLVITEAGDNLYFS